jgi:Na+-transporting methylmalonyl-CoA/oxaloacetate decarboxylase beta subunit
VTGEEAMTDGGRPLIIIAHRILIGTAICFGVFYTVWEALAFRRTQEAVHIVIALVAAVITLGLAYYLKNLRRFVSHR